MKLRSFSKNGRPNYFQSIISLRGLLSRFVSSKLGIKRDAIIRCNGRDAYPITLINNLFMTRFSSRTTRTLRTLKIRCSMEWTAGVEWFTRLFCSSLVSPVYRLSIIINEERCNLEVASMAKMENRIDERWIGVTVNAIFPRGWLCNCTENGRSQVHSWCQTRARDWSA